MYICANYKCIISSSSSSSKGVRQDHGAFPPLLGVNQWRKGKLIKEKH